MNRSKITGWKNVYGFTLIQTMKGKAIRITTLILCMVALLSVPVIQMLSDAGEKKDAVSPIKTVYVVDESGLGTGDFSGFTKISKNYGKTKFITDNRKVSEITKELEKSSNKKTAILLHITYEDGTFILNFLYGKDSGVSKNDVNKMSEDIASYFTEYRINALQIDKDQLKLINTPVNTDVQMTDTKGEKLEDVDQSISMNEYGIILGGITIIVMFIAFSGEGIASSIVTEKSTRVIEYLMISIRPLAIVVGKVLAMLTIVIMQFVLFGISFFISTLVGAYLYGSGDKLVLMPKSISGILTPEMLSGMSLLKILIAVLILVSGFLFYGIVAGLAGAAVSKLEEMAEGLKLYNFVMVIGAYIGIALAIMNLSGNEGGAFKYVACLLPISAPFVMPVYLLLGKVPVYLGAISLMLLILSLTGCMLFVAKVYESMIFYNGATLKMKDILHLSKQSGKENG